MSSPLVAPSSTTPAIADMASASHAGRVPATALTTRAADFWLLGGLSVVAWIVLRVLDPFLSPAAPPTLGTFARTYVAHLAGAGAIASLLVNYPHFMASYRLAYAPGMAHVRKHWFSLAAVPATLAGMIALGWIAWQMGAGALLPVSSAFAALGVESPFAPDVTVGAAAMAVLVHLLLLATGWHYGKQAYGACLVYAKYDGYALDEAQRTLLRWSIHGVWISKWLQRLSPSATYDLHGVLYRGFGFPSFLFPAATVVSGVLLAAVLVFVVLRNRRATGRLPSLNTAVPFVAFLVWWFPPFYNAAFTDTLVPVFHALQYMAFVTRVESASLATPEPATTHLRFTALAFALVITGALAFELVPKSLDVWTGSVASTNASFFLAGIFVFLNLHHYCIDAAIWRMRDAEVRDVLFFEPRPRDA